MRLEPPLRTRRGVAEAVAIGNEISSGASELGPDARGAHLHFATPSMAVRSPGENTDIKY